MKLPRIIIIAACMAIAAFLAFRRSGNGDGEGFPPADPVFARPVSHIELFDAEFGEALQILSKQADTPVRADWTALAAAGIGPDTPVTVRYANSTLGRTLSFLANESAGGIAGLGYRIDHGSIIVSTFAASAPNLICRMYDLADLIDQVETLQAPSTSDRGAVVDAREWRFTWQPKDNWFAIHVDWRIAYALSVPGARGSRGISASVLFDFMLTHACVRAQPDARLKSVRFHGDRVLVVGSPALHEAFSGILTQLRRRELP